MNEIREKMTKASSCITQFCFALPDKAKEVFLLFWFYRWRNKNREFKWFEEVIELVSKVLRIGLHFSESSFTALMPLRSQDTSPWPLSGEQEAETLEQNSSGKDGSLFECLLCIPRPTSLILLFFKHNMLSKSSYKLIVSVK